MTHRYNLATIRMGAEGHSLTMAGREFNMLHMDRGMKTAVGAMLCEAAGIVAKVGKGTSRKGRRS